MIPNHSPMILHHSRFVNDSESLSALSFQLPGPSSQARQEIWKSTSPQLSLRGESEDLYTLWRHVVPPIAVISPRSIDTSRPSDSSWPASAACSCSLTSTKGGFKVFPGKAQCCNGFWGGSGAQKEGGGSSRGCQNPVFNCKCTLVRKSCCKWNWIPPAWNRGGKLQGGAVEGGEKYKGGKISDPPLVLY